MADLRIPLLDQNQNQSDDVSKTLPPPLSPTLPSTPTSTNVSPPGQNRQNLGNSGSPNSSSPNGLFLSLQSCCPPSLLFNRRPGHARALRFPAPPSPQTDLQTPSNGQMTDPPSQELQPTDHQTPSNGQLDHLQGGTNEEAVGNAVSGSLPPLTNNLRQVMGEDDIRGSLPTLEELLSYRQGIYPMPDYKVSIRSEAELKDLWKLVLERREIQKCVENTIKCGREHSKILGFVGSLVLLFSTMIDAEIDEHLSNTKKVVIFGVFLVIIIVYMIVSNIQLHYIYNPALSDARIRYADLLVMTNLARRKLLVLNSKPRVASSIRKEWELQKKFDEYCEEIQKPLLVRWNRCLSFVELNSIALALLIAFIVKGMPSKPKHH